MDNLEVLGYHGRNNSIPVMDSLDINNQIVKSGMGYDTTLQPVVGDRYDTINNIGSIVGVSGKSITIKKDSGFPNLNTEVTNVIPVNSKKSFNVGTYYYRDGYGNHLSTLQKNWEKFNSQ